MCDRLTSSLRKCFSSIMALPMRRKLLMASVRESTSARCSRQRADEASAPWRSRGYSSPVITAIISLIHALQVWYTKHSVNNQGTFIHF